MLVKVLVHVEGTRVERELPAPSDPKLRSWENPGHEAADRKRGHLNQYHRHQQWLLPVAEESVEEREKHHRHDTTSRTYSIGETSSWTLARSIPMEAMLMLMN